VKLSKKKTLVKAFAATALALSTLFGSGIVKDEMEEHNIPTPVQATFNAIIRQQWNDMMKRHNNADPEICAAVYNAVAPVGEGRSIETVADEVNRFINENFKYISDKEQNDAWQYVSSPEEMCISRQGDCEDFAVLKYFMLRHLGVPAHRLFVAGVDTENRNHAVNVTLDHAILMLDVSDNADGTNLLLLDNRYQNMKNSRESEYRYYQSINEYGLWPHAQKPVFRDWGRKEMIASYNGLIKS
jgi:predicted transglutaminase-like cysteine proteinase